MIKNEIFEAKDGKRLQNCSDKELGKIISDMTVLLGLPVHESKDEATLLAGSLKSTYGTFTNRELMLAVKLKQQGVMQVDTETFGRPLNSQIISKLLIAYRSIKTEILTKDRPSEPGDDFPDEYKEQLLANGVRRIYAEFKRDEDYLIQNLMVFFPYLNRLKRAGLIQYSEQDIEAARTQARGIANQMVETTVYSRAIKVDQHDIDKYTDYVLLFNYFRHCKVLGKNPI